MPIETLITAPDWSEAIRDRIASILLTESAAQQALASAQVPPLSTDPWKLRVFLERSHPWSEFQDADNRFEPPIINICIDTSTPDKSASNVVERQKHTTTFNIDCYGYARSRGNGQGHLPADELAAFECQRAVRLVRKILMAAHYTYLGYPPNTRQEPERRPVWGRWIQSITYFQPAIDERPVQAVRAARIAFQVDHNEFSPQVVGAPLEYVEVTVQRDPDTGEVLLVAGYGEETP